MRVVGRAMLPCSECAVTENRRILILLWATGGGMGLPAVARLSACSNPTVGRLFFGELKRYCEMPGQRLRPPRRPSHSRYVNRGL